MIETDEKWKAIRAELSESLSRLEGIASDRAVAYLDQIESRMLAIVGMNPEQAREALDDLSVNARGELYILGIEAETESARITLFAIRLATGLLRASIGVA